jgi:23S rRNA (cytosine1962-C5)-methyltransferase
LILDRYADCAVLKLYSPVWFPHLERIVGLIKGELQPNHLVLRLSRNSEEAAAAMGFHDGKLMFDAGLKNPVVFVENGLWFEADVLRGQKTGFFLDQRDNRKRVGELAAGRDVLNVFSHAGAFSVYAAAGGARSTADLDISEHALQAAARNVKLNSANAKIASCPHRTIKADAFDWLSSQADSSYDLIIIDPPSLAKRELEKEGAINAYQQLAREGFRLLRPGGIFVSASCSSHVSADEFFEIARHAARQSRAPVSEFATTLHAADHPAAIPEAHYLKCIFLKKNG